MRAEFGTLWPPVNSFGKLMSVGVVTHRHSVRDYVIRKVA